MKWKHVHAGGGPMKSRMIEARHIQVGDTVQMDEGRFQVVYHYYDHATHVAQIQMTRRPDGIVQTKSFDLDTLIEVLPREVPSSKATDGVVPPDGRKDDQGKPQYRLLPTRGLAAIVDVLTFGAAKYAPNNWMKVPDASARYEDALLRHLFAWKAGEKNDPESGLPHLAHAGCCLLFLMHFELEDK